MLVRCLASGGSVLVLAGTVRAELFQYTFTGTWDAGTSFTVPASDTLVGADDPFELVIVFDDNAIDQNPLDGFATFPLVSARFETNGAVLEETGGQVNMDAQNDGESDVFVATTSFGDPFFVDVTALLNDGSLNEEPPPTLEDGYQSASVSVNTSKGLFTGTVNSFAAETIPTPGTAVIFGAAIFGGARRRRRA